MAALRFGEWIVPVLPGTTLVSRLAVPLGSETHFTRVPGPGLSAAAAPRLTLAAAALEPEAAEDGSMIVFTFLDDPHGVFADPPPPGAAPLAAPLAAPPGSVDAVPGVATFIGCFISPSNLCRHAGMKVTVSQVPHGDTVYLIKAADMSNPYPLPYTTLMIEPSDVFDPLPTEPGLHIGRTDFYVRLDHKGSTKTLPGRCLPVHYCVFPPAVFEPVYWICTCEPDDPCGPECPCGRDGTFCPCSHGDPWAVPYADADTCAAVQTRRGRTLVSGGTPEIIPVTLPAPNSPEARKCSLCGCQDLAAPTPQAAIWLRTAAVAVTPGALATSGVFRVCGTRPSTNFGSEVFTYTVNGRRYSRGRYTVAGVSNYLAAAGGPVAAPPYPRIACGVTNALVLWTGVQLPAGAVTLSLAGSGGAALLVRNRLTGELDTLVSGTNDTFSCTIAAWRGKYVHPGTLFAEAMLVGGTPGTCTLTHRYAHTGENEHDVHAAAAQAFQVIEVVKEAVTAERDASGHLYNPTAVPQGGTAKFRIKVNPPGAVPENDIVWAVALGADRVSFVGGSRGREVTIQGSSDQSGTFSLEPIVTGVCLDPHPYFVGDVLPETTIAATVWTVASAPGGPYPASAARVHTMVAEANKILRQAAMKVEWNGTLCTTNRADWYNLVITNRTIAPHDPARQLVDIARNTGGIEIYLLNSISYLNQAALGFNEYSRGIALSATASGNTLAHELLHQCGLKDIYNNNGAAVVAGPVAADRMHQDDWGGGYYPQGLQQAGFNEGRLLMYGSGSSASVAADIPHGSVYGYGYIRNGSDELELKLVPVGRSDMSTRQPVHNQ